MKLTETGLAPMTVSCWRKRLKDPRKFDATLEALESYYRRAKDADGLFSAVAAKLGERRRFILWWDVQEKDKGGRPGKNPSQIADEFLNAADFGLGRGGQARRAAALRPVVGRTWLRQAGGGPSGQKL